MSNLMSIDSPEFGQIRVLSIDGEPWIVGKDAAVALGYVKPENAIAAHVDAEDKTTTLIQGSGSNYKTHATIINESGFYALAFSSKLPNAKKFKRWVTNEVLPSIREHGTYMTPQTLDKMIQSPEFGIKLLTALKEEQEKRLALEEKVAAFKPVQDYVQQILSSKGTLTTTQIAADYNISANRLNRILSEERIQRKVNNQWILYQKYMGKGYTESETIQITRTDGRPDTVMHTRWTQRGRLMIHELLTKRGINARFDEREGIVI